MKFFSILILFLFLLISCNKELKYTKEDILKLAQKNDPTVTVILPQSMTEGIHCSEYSEGCIAGHIIRIKKLDMIGVEFVTEEQAILAAKKVRGFYSRNWLFDDVKGEPILEKFVTDVLNAQEP